jgi:hypothetical protein
MVNRKIAGSSKYDIHSRIYSFIVRVINVVNKLPKTDSNSMISQQLLRCATSMGANDREADGRLQIEASYIVVPLSEKKLKRPCFG